MGTEWAHARGVNPTQYPISATTSDDYPHPGTSVISLRFCRPRGSARLNPIIQWTSLHADYLSPRAVPLTYLLSTHQITLPLCPHLRLMTPKRGLLLKMPLPYPSRCDVPQLLSPILQFPLHLRARTRRAKLKHKPLRPTHLCWSQDLRRLFLRLQNLHKSQWRLGLVVGYDFDFGSIPIGQPPPSSIFSWTSYIELKANSLPSSWW